MLVITRISYYYTLWENDYRDFMFFDWTQVDPFLANLLMITA